jgi:alpha-beta hydrolase superfamily lysophospholipase
MSSVLPELSRSEADQGHSIATSSGLNSHRRNAFYFDSGQGPLLGWLHRATGNLRNVGLVICKPFGYEALCAHRSLRCFAEDAAEFGIPSLHVDYLGTGDSSDIDPSADQISTWTRDIIAAVKELRERAPIQQVCVLGVRLGALLAVLAAEECKDITSLVLISPIVSGRRYLRSLRTARLAASLSSEGSSAESTEGGGDGMEASGFMLSAATIASLNQLDLKTRAVPPVSDILVIDGKSLPGGGPWAKQLAEAGIRTQYLELPGLIEMIMTAPQDAQVPREMIAATRHWLGAISKTELDHGGLRHRGEPGPASASIVVQQENAEDPLRLTEKALFFGADKSLFGVITEPRIGEIRRRGVILLNAGSDSHIGANRLNVSLAREWASRGYVALRIDIGGLGDSHTRPGQPDDVVFPPAALDDIAAAVELLRTRYAARDVSLVGLCSGAYHALRAAVAGVPVNRILMVNPQHYFWKEGDTLADLQLAEVVHNPRLYMRRLFSREAWRRMFGGRVNLWRIARIYAYRPMLALESRMRDLARRARIRLPNDLGSELAQIYERGIRIVLVFARGEPGIDLLKLQAGSSVKKLGEYCRIHIIDGADHVFSQSAPRTLLRNTLSGELFARN